ncbi:hypothetical protein V7056_12875 [Bacillus sp. JJ664]
MKNETLYFNENFFSTGITDIYNESKEIVGKLDLKSMFSSGVDVLDLHGNIVASGKFPFLSSKWKISNQSSQEIGSLRGRFSFFSKKYEYDAYGKYTFQIKSEAFSKLYEVFKDETTLVCKFEKINGFFSSPAFRLESFKSELSSEELILLVMGVYAIQRRNNSGANSASTTM